MLILLQPKNWIFWISVGEWVGCAGEEENEGINPLSKKD
jgi:hypothetical protein